MNHHATEAAAERAIATLKRAIEAAENSNQAGEDFVVAAASGPTLLASLKEVVGRLSGVMTQFDHAGCTCTFPSDYCCFYATTDASIERARAAISLARGERA